jgi:hypothetical protein
MSTCPADRTSSVFRPTTSCESNIIDFFENQAFSAKRKEKTFMEPFPLLKAQMVGLIDHAGMLRLPPHQG